MTFPYADREDRGSTARRSTGIIAAGAAALGAAALLVSATQYGEIALAVLVIVVAVGVLQVPAAPRVLHTVRALEPVEPRRLHRVGTRL